jgi:hypothetical protein
MATKTNLVYMHHECGPLSGLHFNAGVKKPPVKETRPDTALDGLIDCALQIAHKDAALRRSLKAAIQRDDVAATLQAACSLLGVEPSGSIRALILSHTKAA